MNHIAVYVSAKKPLYQIGAYVVNEDVKRHEYKVNEPHRYNNF